ncbi:MAG TPA: DinB family protein [Bacteroidia bacterium]|nr:DinB family protein [Bacteroidia bacterium]
METQKQLIVKSVLDAWHSRLEAANKAFDSLTDEQLQNEVSPNKNRAIYLLGHLTAVHDKMLPLLNFEQQQFPHLDDVFLSKPDRSVSEIPSAKDLRANWKSVNSKLATHFNNLSPDEWFQKHSSVSAEDFVKEPHRNRLNVVIGRTNHLAYHLGQLALIKK